MIEADSVHSTPPLNTSALPFAESAHAFSAGLAIQQRERAKALRKLVRLRKRAFAEIERLIEFIDQSDPYVMTELEDDDDREPEPDEPSLGFLERHPSQYGAERDGSGNQERICDGDRAILDAEDEHDGREPDCEDEGAQCDDEGADADREDNEPLLTECSGAMA